MAGLLCEHKAVQVFSSMIVAAWCYKISQNSVVEAPEGRSAASYSYNSWPRGSTNTSAGSRLVKETVAQTLSSAGICGSCRFLELFFFPP